MTKITGMIFLVLLLTMHTACVDHKSTEKATNHVASVTGSTTDTLSFTSGIRAIFQDSKGNYWFGSLQEGLAVYDGKSFRYFTMNEGLQDNQIHGIQEDQQGNIWFSTQHGISRYDGTSIKRYTDQEAKVFHFQHTKPVPGKWMKSDKDLWFGAGNKEGVHRFDGQDVYYLAFPPHKAPEVSESLLAVTGISKGKHKMIWFATYTSVYGYNGTDFTIIDDEALGYDRKIAPLHIRSILEDSKGRLWIGNNGIGALLREGDSTINFSKKHHLIHPDSKLGGATSPQGTLEHIFTIAEDKSGNIWFGDRDAGIWKYDGVGMTNYTMKDGLSHAFALAIFEDKKGDLLFGMADGNIFSFNGKTFDKRF